MPKSKFIESLPTQNAVPQVPPRSSSSSLRTVVVHSDNDANEPNNEKNIGNTVKSPGNTSGNTVNKKESPVKSIRYVDDIGKNIQGDYIGCRLLLR